MLFVQKRMYPENNSGRECCWSYLIGQHPLSPVFSQKRPGTPGNSCFAQLPPVFGLFMFLSSGLLECWNRSTWATRAIESKISKALHGRLAGRFKLPLAGRCNDFAPSRQKNCHRQKPPSRPGPREKTNTAPSRSVGKKKKPPRPASEKKKKRPVPPRKKNPTAPSRLGKKKKNAPSRLEKKNKPPRPAMNSKIHRPEGGNWKQIPPPVSFSLSCCTFISYCSLVRSIF